MKIIFIFSFLFLSYEIIIGQNFVKNFSFEEYKECPESHNPENKSHKIIPGWTYPNEAAPDYFNRCAGNKDAGVPRNFAGVSEPQDGNGYVGAILTGTEENRREYIQGELIKPMDKDVIYCVTFYYRLASGSRLAVDQLGVYFSNNEIKTQGTNALQLIPQYSTKEGLFLDDVEEWKQICFTYKAKGGEKFFIVGNFKDYDHTNYVVTDKNIVNYRNKAYAYYYFDNFNIRPLNNCKECPCVKQNMEVKIVDTFYTGGRHPVTGEIKQIVNDGRIRIVAIGGTPPYTITWNNGMNSFELKNLPAGTHKYVVKDMYNCQSTGTIIFKEPKIVKDEFIDELKNIDEGESIILNNIFFEFDKTTLLPESYIELDKIASFLLENRFQKVEIAGHTDNIGSDSYNQKLSEGRAKAVVDYLVSKGVNPASLKAVGYGKTKPIDTNQNEKGRSKNRRVEFTLLKK